MARIRANGVELHVQRLPPQTGTGTSTGASAGTGGPARVPATVVFLHGAFIDSLASYYFTLGPEFAAAGFDTVMYDLRGHGRSERPPSGYAVEDFAADLDALLDQLGIEQPVHLVGNFFGGTVALDYAVHHPRRTASVTAIESVPATREWAEAMAGALRRAALMPPGEEALAWFVHEYGGGLPRARLGGAAQDAQIVRFGRAAGPLFMTTTIAREIHAGRRLTERQLRCLGCPVLFINGSEGFVRPQTARLAALLPECAVEVLPGEKHSVLVEAPEKVCELALRRIRRQLRTPHEQGSNG